MNDLRVAYIQTALAWEDSEANLKMFDGYLDKITDTDLVVFPEMFNTGFSMNVEKLAQSVNGKVVSWMKSKALENNFAIAGSIMAKDHGRYVNRFIMAYPCGDAVWYDKRHLFRMGEEDKVFSPGKSIEVFNFYGWKVRPLICYDLRFPVWSRNRNDYDLLIYVANWPAPRRHVWETLLKARAIENQCYVIGVNRIGTDGMGLSYSGNSVVIDPKGFVISALNEGETGIGNAVLNLDELNQFREKFPVHLDADEFTINGLDT
jgi:predicted amidohydrolase